MQHIQDLVGLWLLWCDDKFRPANLTSWHTCTLNNISSLLQLFIQLKHGNLICNRSWMTFSFPTLNSTQIAITTDGLDADLWKDGLFKSKVTRYLCFTRVFSKENVSWLQLSNTSVPIPNWFLIIGAVFSLHLLLIQSHLGNVLVDMKLIDIKDTLPVGFIPIQETVDTREWPAWVTRQT